MIHAIIIALSLASISYMLCKIAVPFLWKYRIIDKPNHRSSHTKFTPKGGGVVVTTLICLSVLIYAFVFSLPKVYYPLLLGCAILAAISLLDDIYCISARLRLAIQFLICGFILWIHPITIHPELGPLNYLITLIAWAWFINLFNFMDGIDGITAQQSIIACISILLASQLIAISSEVVFFSLIIASTMIGFAFINWHPAKMFLGDVGSIPLGYLIGWLLLNCVNEGYWILAILPLLYHWFDATSTLLWRMLKGERFWLAHRFHAFQTASKHLPKHSQVVKRIIGLNILLVLCTLGFLETNMIFYPLIGLALTISLVAYFRKDHLHQLKDLFIFRNNKERPPFL